MKCVLYSIWNDIKKCKTVTALLCIEILVVILVVAVFMTSTLIENNYISFYNEKDNGMTLVQIGDGFDLEEMDGKIGVDKYACGVTEYNEDGAITAINYYASKYFKVEHVGDWFSGDEQNDYSEALVSRTLKKKYTVGRVYQIPIRSGVSCKIKVIGYLNSKDTAITLSTSSYDGTYGERKILICDSRLIDKSEVSCFATFERPPQFYADNYNLDAKTLGESYETYKVDTKGGRHYISLILGMLFATVAVCILCNSIFKTERDIKRNMIKFVVGNSNRYIIIGEIIKCSIIYIIPFLIVLCITAAMSAAATATKSLPLISWTNFIISASVVLVVYVLATVFGLIRVVTAKPLKELRRM